jgi:CheY-like chemotaxis protein
MGPRDIVYGDEPAVLVFADTELGLQMCSASVTAAGGRVAAALPIAEAVARLDEQAHLDAVLVDCTGDPGEMFDRLLDRLDLAARTGRHPSVITVAPNLIDAVAARCSHDRVTLLCAPAAVDRVAATGFALGMKRGDRLHDRGEETPVEPRILSEEVGRIARTLAALSGEQLAHPRDTPGDLAADGPLSAAAIRAIIRARRLREHYFDSALFADPAWDMLLDLTAARIEGRPVAVSSLCIAAAVPPTTALRWIRTLTEIGLFVRVADQRDGRRVFIELSDSAAEGMAAYFAAVDRLGGGFA